MIQPQHLVGEVADQQMRPAAAVIIAGIRAHRAARHAVFPIGHAGRHAAFHKTAFPGVAIQFVGLRIVGHEKVRPPVAVIVQHGHAQRLAGRVADTCRLGNVLESPAAQIVIQARPRAFVGFRRAIGFRGAVERAPEVVLGRPLHIVGDEQVHLAVAIVIQPRGAGAEIRILDPGGFGDIGELAVAQVVKQAVALQRRDVHVFAAVIVIVRDATPMPYISTSRPLPAVMSVNVPL